jgi:hypothetical protein
MPTRNAYRLAVGGPSRPTLPRVLSVKVNMEQVVGIP